MTDDNTQSGLGKDVIVIKKQPLHTLGGKTFFVQTRAHLPGLRVVPIFPQE